MEPAGPLGEEPAGPPGVEPAGPPGMEPAGPPGEEPAGQPGEEPAGQPGEEPAGPPGVEPVGRICPAFPGGGGSWVDPGVPPRDSAFAQLYPKEKIILCQFPPPIFFQNTLDNHTFNKLSSLLLVLSRVVFALFQPETNPKRAWSSCACPFLHTASRVQTPHNCDCKSLPATHLLRAKRSKINGNQRLTTVDHELKVRQLLRRCNAAFALCIASSHDMRRGVLTPMTAMCNLRPVGQRREHVGQRPAARHPAISAPPP